MQYSIITLPKTLTFSFAIAFSYTDLAFETEFVPSSYFKDLISALKNTSYPMASGLDLLGEEPKLPHLPSLSLDAETRPGMYNYIQ